MHAHRVEVFDGTDDDAVVVFVTHHLHLELFPTEQRFFDQQLFGRRQLQTVFADADKFFMVVGDAATTATHGEAGANHRRKAQRFLHRMRFFERVRNTGAGRAETDFGHRVFELGAVLGLLNGVLVGANKLDVVAFKRAIFRQLHGGIECGLSAHRWQ